MSTNADYDRAYLRYAFDLLERYLLSDDLYWQVSLKAPKGAPPYPSLTPGNILLSLRRLKARGAADDFQAELEAAKAKWGAHWRQKEEREANARFRQWRDFLTQYGQEADEPAPYYHYEVRERVILRLLEEDLGDLPPEVAVGLRKLDEILRASFAPGEFIWEPDLQPAFPRDEFWFLYGTLK